MDKFKIFIRLGLVLAFTLWFFFQRKDRRSFFNGLFFLVGLASLWLLALFFAMHNEIRILQTLLVLAFLFIILLVPLAYLAFIIMLFTTGRTLVRREGMSLAHFLSIGLGLAIILSSLALPFIREMDSYRLLRSLILFGAGYFSYFYIGFLIFTASALVYSLYRQRKNKDFIIVLGSRVYGDRVSPLLASRIDRALDFYREQEKKGRKPPRLIMSGGQGPDEEVSEAYAMKKYCLERGLAEEDVLMEDRSTSTYENLKFSSQIIDSYGLKNPQVLFSTSNYHVFRAALLAKSLGLDYHGIGSRTRLYFSISAFIREYIGILYINRRKNLVAATIFALLQFLISYYK